MKGYTGEGFKARVFYFPTICSVVQYFPFAVGQRLESTCACKKEAPGSGGSEDFSGFFHSQLSEAAKLV